MALLFILTGAAALATFNVLAQRPWVGSYSDNYNSDKSPNDPHPDKPDQWDTPGTNVQEYAVNPSQIHHGKKHGVNLHHGNTDKKSGNFWKG